MIEVGAECVQVTTMDTLTTDEAREALRIFRETGAVSPDVYVRALTSLCAPPCKCGQPATVAAILPETPAGSVSRTCGTCVKLGQFVGTLVTP